MTLIVTGKGDFTLLPRFTEDDFTSYELYLGLIDEKTFEKARQLPPYIRIISIHTPTWILVNGKHYPFDLGQTNPIGKEALKALTQTITLAKQVGAKVVVVHGASYHAFLESKEEAMHRLAELVRPLLDSDRLGDTQRNTLVKLCFETDVLWHNLYYSRRALLTSEEDFGLLKLLLPTLKITADFEHLSITFHFKEFIAQVGGENAFLQRYSEVAQGKFEVDCQRFIKENFAALQEKFKQHLLSFFTTFHDEIEHIHLNGSDCCNYLFHPQTSLPFIGEHLPLGLEDENIFGKVVSDKLDYPFIASLLHSLPKEKTIHAVMEIWRTNPDAFIKNSRESKRFLEKHLAKVKSPESLINENPEKRLSPTLKGGDLRRFSETDFQKSNVAKSIVAFIPNHKWLGFLLI